MGVMGELLQRFNHYGFERKTYDECKGLIAKSNQSNALIINFWFALVNAFYYVCAMFGFFSVDHARQLFYASFMLAAFIIIAMIVFIRKKGPAFNTVIILLDLVMFETYSVMASNAEPYTTCWIFLILIVIVALSYVGTMTRMVLILLGMSILFCYLSFLNKPLSIASMDIANTVVVTSLALVLHFAFQRGRVREFATTIRNEQTQRMLEVSSYFDTLTSLLNRGKFFAMTEELLANRREDEPLALLILDLDGFKQINDTYGHQMGDTAIKLAAQAIRDGLGLDLSDQWDFPSRVMREGGSFAGRLGGDEFVVLLRGFASRDDIMTAAHELHDELHKVDSGVIHGLRASMGITMVGSGDNADEAYKRADKALYTSKGNGKDQITAIQF